jgi:hypothetical protein
VREPAKADAVKKSTASRCFFCARLAATGLLVRCRVTCPLHEGVNSVDFTQARDCHFWCVLNFMSIDLSRKKNCGIWRAFDACSGKVTRVQGVSGGAGLLLSMAAVSLTVWKRRAHEKKDMINCPWG